MCDVTDVPCYICIDIYPRQCSHARPKMLEFDRPVDGGLGATLGGIEDEDKLCDGVIPASRQNQQTQQEKEIAGRLRPNNEWSPVAALEDTVSRMQRDLEELQMENRFLRTSRAPGARASSAHGDKGTLV